MQDPRFWHPNIHEWRAACEFHPEWDPKSTLMKKDGTFIAIWAKDAPSQEEIDKGKKIVSERRRKEREAEWARQKEELARTEAEAMRESMEREKKRKQLEKSVERSKDPAVIKRGNDNRARKKREFTEDDPFQASVVNAVDKDSRAKNANSIIHAKRISDMPKIAITDVEAVRERIDWYYQLCATDGIKPNLPGLALAFGLTRTGLMNAVSDKRMPRDAAQEIGRGIAMLDEIVSEMTLGGRINPVASIYFLNNWLGYRNASEVTTRTEVVEPGVDQKALEQKYQTVIDME